MDRLLSKLLAASMGETEDFVGRSFLVFISTLGE